MKLPVPKYNYDTKTLGVFGMRLTHDIRLLVHSGTGSSGQDLDMV